MIFYKLVKFLQFIEIYALPKPLFNLIRDHKLQFSILSIF